MKLDHIGYLTGDIAASAAAMTAFGYTQSGPVWDDDRQQCHIAMLTAPDATDIELVQPYDDNAPMQKMLRKRGAGPYHLCYSVNDVDDLYKSLAEQEGWTPLFAPVPAVAFGGRLITYFLNAETGFVEFVNAR